MPPTMTTRCLELAMERVRQDHPALALQGMGGHCDAVAMALVAVLGAHGVDAGLVTLERTRRSLADGAEVEQNPLSHVVVAALGTQWDVGGPGAVDRWIEAWVQPDEDDEATACEDVFDDRPLAAEALEELRMKQDARRPCAQVQAQAQQALEQGIGWVLGAAATQTGRASTWLRIGRFP